MFVLLNKMIGGNEEGQIISKHRTAKAAGRAASRILRKVERNNGKGSYLPLSLRRLEKGKIVAIDEDDVLEYQEGQIS